MICQKGLVLFLFHHRTYVLNICFNRLSEAIITNIQNKWFLKYSRLTLSRPRLTRTTAYLEMKIWTLFSHENLTAGNKILWKREEIAPRSNFSSFPQYF